MLARVYSGTLDTWIICFGLLEVVVQRFSSTRIFASSGREGGGFDGRELLARFFVVGHCVLVEGNAREERMQASTIAQPGR